MKISSNQDYSSLGYYFLMFMVDYYKRVGKLKLSFDEMMVLNTVASHLAYNLDSSQTLSIDDVLNLKNEKIQEIHRKSKLSILSIANILDQPKESIRRRVNKLIKLNLIIKDEKAYVQAGAGIVYDSIPESEYEETLNKAKALLEVQR